MDSLSKVIKFSQCNKHVQESLNIIEKAFSQYQVDNTCVSFNGGKDCTAILHLVRTVVNKLGTCSNNNNHKLNVFYARLPNHFEQESEFVDSVAKQYNLRLLQYSEGSLKESLNKLKIDHPNIEAIFIGTRRDDFEPGTNIGAFQKTDKSWPSYMRVNPILNWSYKQVWDFIRESDIPYCDLYNQGYSSLGTKIDTKKNSSLIRYNQNGEPYYLPPWSLVKSDEERLSRSSSLDISNKSSPSK